MPYEIIVPKNRLDLLFGVAFPNLQLDSYQKINILTIIIKNISKIKYGINIDYEETTRDFIPNKQIFKIQIDNNGRSNYQAAIDITNFIKTLPRLSTHHKLFFWRYIWQIKVPSDVFFIGDLNYFDIFKWLQEHCTVHDYQIFNRFGGDYSLGFKNPEHAAMFKLTFGEAFE